MPSKDFRLDDDLIVTVYKRRTNRHLRLTVTPSGKVRVSIPVWTSYRAGVAFAQSRQAWIRQQQQPTALLKQGQAIGKAHHLEFVRQSTARRPTSRLYDTRIVVSYPVDSSPDDAAVQVVAQRAGVRALRRQAEQLLPQRVALLATTHDFRYTTVNIKALKSRWGSCDHHRNIVLNLFLMQLPWELIDYVLLHELTHTQVLRHGPDFWQAMSTVLPETPSLRRRLRDYQPILSSLG